MCDAVRQHNMITKIGGHTHTQPHRSHATRAEKRQKTIVFEFCFFAAAAHSTADNKSRIDEYWAVERVSGQRAQVEWSFVESSRYLSYYYYYLLLCNEGRALKFICINMKFTLVIRYMQPEFVRCARACTCDAVRCYLFVWRSVAVFFSSFSSTFQTSESDEYGIYAMATIQRKWNKIADACTFISFSVRKRLHIFASSIHRFRLLIAF